MKNINVVLFLKRIGGTSLIGSPAFRSNPAAAGISTTIRAIPPEAAG